MIKGVFVFNDIHAKCLDRLSGLGSRVVDLWIWFNVHLDQTDSYGAIMIEPDEGVQRDAFIRAGFRFVENAPGFATLNVAKLRPEILWRPDEFTDFSGVIRSALISGGWDGRSIDGLGDAFLPELLAWPMKVIHDILRVSSSPIFSRHDGTPIPFERYWSLAS